ncbi:UNVERIFIED_CONTAM: hypothetical protein PYX00_010510 [Menopon gallinae]|uniref:Phospholipid scramblase n=1 Tax=Menopon gallinae TaxID=328185 RepID=A0AAW2HFM2_9NEOP
MEKKKKDSDEQLERPPDGATSSQTAKPGRKHGHIAFAALHTPKRTTMHRRDQHQPQSAPLPPNYYTSAYPNARTGGGAAIGGPGVMYFQNPLMDFAHWAPYPASIPPGIPPGLAHLMGVDCILVLQQVSLMEAMMDWHQACKFMVLNAEGYCIFYAYETSGIWARCCCHDSRPLQIHVKDMYQNEMIYMNRMCGCSQYPCLFQCCCLTAMEVYSMPFTPIGAVIGHSAPGSILLDIVDADENVLFHVQQQTGCLCVYCFYEAEFAITALDGNETEIGLIRKQWGGLFRDMLSNGDVFTVNFPQDLDVKVKALFIAAMFLINYMYYED